MNKRAIKLQESVKRLFVGFIFIFSSVFNSLFAGYVPSPPGGGGGTVGPGAPPTTPIDMYQILLFAIAVMLLIYVTRKKLIKNN